MKVIKVAETTITPGGDICQSGYRFSADDWEVTDADNLFEAAGRGCYQSYRRPNPKTAKNKDYLAHILEIGHESILEHASVTLYVEDVSRALLLELERHRHISFSVVSQRYVDSASTVIYPFVDHPLLRELGEPEQAAIRNRVTEGRILYENIVDELTLRGHSRKVARGAARNVLEEGTTTKFFVSGNVRAWRGIIQQRYSAAADAEIREFAGKVLEILKDYCPNAVQDLELQ